MRIDLVSASRRPPWPRWAVVAVLLWLAGGATAMYLAQLAHVTLTLCLVKLATGYPCPTCGTTRSLLCVAHGDILGALAFNPLVFIIGFFLAASLAVRVCLGRRVQVTLGPRQRVAATVAFIAAVIINWAYLVYCHR